MRKTAVLSYKMTQADLARPDGTIPIGRQFDFIGDVETELMILHDGDESLCLGYRDVHFFEEVYVGDEMDFKATLIKVGNTSRTCKIQSFKVATQKSRLGDKSAVPWEMEYFAEPHLVAEGIVTLVVKKELQRGIQPDGIVKNPWIEIK